MHFVGRRWWCQGNCALGSSASGTLQSAEPCRAHRLQDLQILRQYHREALQNLQRSGYARRFPTI